MTPKFVTLAVGHYWGYQQLDAACALQDVTIRGDGFGLQAKDGYVIGSTEHAGYTISQPDATTAMHMHTALMDVALANVNGWLTKIDQDALLLRSHPSEVAKVEVIASLADDAYHGVDSNGDGQMTRSQGKLEL